MRARVLVRPKSGILDPQGKAVERALPALGFDGVANVHVGRLIELDVDDPTDLEAMCEKLLANTVIDGVATRILQQTHSGHARGGQRFTRERTQSV